MGRAIHLHPDAEIEFKESVIWYQKQQAGTDLEFVRCIDEAVQKIKRNPRQFPKVYKNLRRVVVKKFPFIILYDFSETEIKIYAVFHSKRNPRIFKRRGAE